MHFLQLLVVTAALAWAQRNASLTGTVSDSTGAANSNGFREEPLPLKTRADAYGAFVQTDWKVNQRLTLNLGVRWDMDQPRHELHAYRQNSFDRSLISPRVQRPGRGPLLGPRWALQVRAPLRQEQLRSARRIRPASERQNRAARRPARPFGGLLRARSAPQRVPRNIQPQPAAAAPRRTLVETCYLGTLSLSLLKDFFIREGHRLQFRGEVLNLPNHPNFGLPNQSRGNANFGRVNSLASGNPSRIFQLGLHYRF